MIAPGNRAFQTYREVRRGALRGIYRQAAGEQGLRNRQGAGPSSALTAGFRVGSGAADESPHTSGHVIQVTEGPKLPGGHVFRRQPGGTSPH